MGFLRKWAKDAAHFFFVRSSQSPVEKKILEMIAPIVGGCGFECVEVRCDRGPQGHLVRVTLDRPDFSGRIGVDDCAAISRTIADVLAVAGLLPGRYRLEVSSPGLERGLVRTKDFEHFCGRKIRLKTHHPLAGRRHFTGLLKGCEAGMIHLEVAGRIFLIPWAEMARAQLVWEKK